MKNKKAQIRAVLFLTLLVAASVAVYTYTKYTPENSISQKSAETSQESSSYVINSENVREISSSVTKEFTVTGTSFVFSPKIISVQKGDKVKIKFKDDDGFHDFVVESYGVSTPRINTGQSATIEFTADKTGTFEYYCSVGSHKQLGMIGQLIVN